MLLILLPTAAYAKVRKQAATPPDVPSGFFPGIINYFAGDGNSLGTYSDGSIPTQVLLDALYTVADSLGNVYIADGGAVYIVYAGGAVPAVLANVTTNATPSVTPQAGRIYQIAGFILAPCGELGFDPTCGEGKPLNQVLFDGIGGLAIDSANNLYFSDTYASYPNPPSANVVRRVDAGTSIVTTVAGQLGVPSATTMIGDGGAATSATLNYPDDIKVDAYGNIFINDYLDYVIRVVYSGSQPPPILAAEGVNVGPSQKGFIYTVAGQPLASCMTPGTCGDGGAATAAMLAAAQSIAVDGAGNLYIADFPYAAGFNEAYIRVVYANGTAPALLNLALAGSAPVGGDIYAVTGYGLSTPFSTCTAAPCGDGGLAADVQFGYSMFLVSDNLGNLYVSDGADYAVRKLDTSGYASTIAGVITAQNTSGTPASPGGPATSTQLSGPTSIAFDGKDNLYIGDGYLEWIVAPLQGQTINFPAFNPATVNYGVSPIALDATATSGLPVSYTVSPANLGTINGSELTVTGAGTLTVTANQAGNGTYSAASPVSETLTVDPAPLTVTANSLNKFFGTPNPAFTATITGLVNGDTASAYTGAPAFSTTATTNSPQGMYPIDVSIGTLASTNYAFTSFVPGTLTIGGNTPQTITFAPLAPITYGQVTTETLVATSSSGLPVTLQVVSGPGRLSGKTLTITGGGTIVITANAAGSGPYEPAPPVTQNLVVNPAALTITGPTVTLGYGVAVNTASFPAPAITGFAAGDTQAAVLTGTTQYTTVTGTPIAGTYPIYVGLGTLALQPAFAADYVIAPTVSGKLIVKPGAGVLNPTPGHIYYFAGDGPGLSGTYVDGADPILIPLPKPTAVAVDGVGNVYFATAGTIYVVYAGVAVPATLANVNATPQMGRIYQITGLNGNICGVNDPDATCGEGMRLNLASFGSIAGMAFDSKNDLFISDGGSQVVRRVDAASSIVTTIAGQLNAPSGSTNIGDGGPAASASLSSPGDIKVDSFGNVYFSDQSGSIARVIYIAGATGAPPVLAAEGITGSPAQTGKINGIAGRARQYCANTPTAGASGSPGACGDFGAAAANTALFLGLDSLVVDPAGNVYFADAHSGSSPKAAYLRTIYVGGTAPALLSAALNGTAPAAGSIYAVTGYGASTKFALCAAAPCGDGGPASGMEFGASANRLFLTLDSVGELFVADSGDWAVRKIDISAQVSTFAGIDNPNQTPPANPPATQGGVATATQLSNSIYALAFDAQQNLYLSDNGDDLVWQVAPLLEQFIDFPAFNPATVSYGVSPIALPGAASSGLAVSYAVTSGPGTIQGSELTVTGAGKIVVSASQAGNAQYSAAASVTESLTVDPVPLTVAANNATRAFGVANPAFTATFTGFVNGDTQATPGIYTGAPAFSTTATTSSPQGTYPITVALGTLASTDYSFATFVPATLTIVGNENQTISFAPLPAVTYGQPTSLTLSATASSGLPVTLKVVSGPGSLAANGTTLSILGGGTIVITATQPGGGAYLPATPVTQSLVVNPAPLTVAGPTVTLQYGATVDPSSFPPVTITGFVGADTQASVVTGSAVYTTVSGTPNAGTYPITVGLGTLAVLPAAAANYVLSAPVNGSLIVQPIAQVINLNPVPATQVYGNFVPLTAVATSGLPVTFSVSGPGFFYNNINTTMPPTNTLVQLIVSGLGAVTVTANQAGGGNYQAAPPLTQVFNVGQAPLNIGVAQNSVIQGISYLREQGAPNPVFQPTIGFVTPAGSPGGFVNGDTDIPAVVSGAPLLTTAATPSSPPGNYDIVPSQGTLSATNYYFVYMNGTLEVTPPGSFAITATPSSLTIQSGLTAQSTLTLTPANYYQGTVTVTCGQLPANVTCVVSPSTYTFPGAQANGATNPAQGTVTITAAGGTVVGAARGDSSISRAATLLIPGALAGLLVALARRRTGRHGGIWGAVMLLALGAGALTIASCGGGSSKGQTAAPGTATVMITGAGTSASGNAAVSSSVALTVTIQ